MMQRLTPSSTRSMKPTNNTLMIRHAARRSSNTKKPSKSCSRGLGRCKTTGGTRLRRTCSLLPTWKTLSFFMQACVLSMGPKLLVQFQSAPVVNTYHQVQGKISNLEVLRKCGLPSIKILIIKAQLRWTGYVVQMPDSHIPKMLLFRQLKERQRGLVRPLLCYKDMLTTNLKSCNTDAATWEDIAADREDGGTKSPKA